ncbi:MAG: tetratricopeptide repeat protein [Bacteroides sp.]|nr:tetratricopeptide repeat protein [Bacteroides sp.]MCM1379427.1 tetratricopeptide repeat protein [Bacteroides sp.]MCM1445287.1 tetratricopeptide repeat protein [Prevotella sp.]
MNVKIQSRSLVLLMGAALMFTGCSKKLGQMPADYFTVNPNPLEVVGQNVPASVTARIPAKYFVKNAELTVTPYLTYAYGETASASYSYQGEKVRGNNPVISYDNGGTVTIPVNYTYVPAMANSKLELAFTVQQGKKQYVLPRVAVADGVIATAALADAASVTPAYAADKFQRVIQDKVDADILFLINQANIRDNQLRTAQMTGLNSRIQDANNDARQEITEINIQSYASPDGSYDFNKKLAQKREDTTKGYMDKQLKGVSFGELTADFTPEDWEGFRRLVSESNIQDKDLILSVLSMYSDPEEREREIHNLSSVFEQLAEEILPQLRYSRISAKINVIGRSDEEIAETFAKNPSELSVDEILYYASLTDNPEKRAQIYSVAAELYPTDYRAYNNLGMAQYQLGDYDAARQSFAQAGRLAPAQAEPQMNIGLVALNDGDYNGAQTRFGNAAGVPELNEALGVYYLKQGDNAAAARAMRDVKSNNAALAQILTKDYSAAKKTLAAIANPDATTYYLTAVLGARTNNESMLTNALRQAVKLDPSMAAKAAGDLEFQRFNLSAIL